MNKLILELSRDLTRRFLAQLPTSGCFHVHHFHPSTEPPEIGLLVGVYASKPGVCIGVEAHMEKKGIRFCAAVADSLSQFRALKKTTHSGVSSTFASLKFDTHQRGLY